MFFFLLPLSVWVKCTSLLSGGKVGAGNDTWLEDRDRRPAPFEILWMIVFIWTTIAGPSIVRARLPCGHATFWGVWVVQQLFLLFLGCCTSMWLIRVSELRLSLSVHGASDKTVRTRRVIGKEEQEEPAFRLVDNVVERERNLSCIFAFETHLVGYRRTRPLLSLQCWDWTCRRMDGYWSSRHHHTSTRHRLRSRSSCCTGTSSFVQYRFPLS